VSFFAEMALGRLRWDLLVPFPRQDGDDRCTGDRAVADLMAFLRSELDPEALDRDGRLPAGFVEGLRARRYLALRAAPEAGGLGLSEVNTVRMLTAACGWSVAVGFMLAIQNGIGAGTHEPNLEPGPLRDLIRRRVAGGALFGMADTEPAGAGNSDRTTTATPVGDAYVLDGEKIFIGNGPLADTLVVSARIGDGVGLLCFDTDTPGFAVRSTQEYLGLRGLPSGALSLRGVRVPAAQQVTRPGRSWRETPGLADTVARGRLYLMAAPALAITRLCARWSREFAGRRRVDGRALGSYEQVQRMVASTLSETYALESVIDWILLGRPEETRAEQVAAKNITSVTCWRAVDRTLSLLGGEGLETVASKARRGAPTLPVERFFRDARALRVAGGVDFLVDLYAARSGLFEPHYAGEGQVDALTARAPAVDAAGLSPRNREYLEHVRSGSTELARTCVRLRRRYPDPERLYERQNLVLTLHRIASELFTMSVTLARAAAQGTSPGWAPAQALAEVYCGEARHRLADWWGRVQEPDTADHRRLSDAWIGAADPWLETLLDATGALDR
jgi:alkylation response protein AidB-like acyl-CoA dehydrogenase